MNALLSLSELTRRYGALVAVDRLDLTVARGARHALIGPNGAGKTTLLGLIAGTVTPSQGRILLDRQDITGTDPARRSRLGIARTFQQPAVLGSLTALDNVSLAAWRHSELRGLWRPRRYRELGRRSHEHLEQVGIGHLAARTADQLSHGQKRLVEIAAALAAQPRLLLLDEPAAGLAEEDTDRLVTVLRQVSTEVAVLLVEHDLAFVNALATRVTVLHEGRSIADGTPEQISADPAVQQAYLGPRAG
ncbi:ABC transporter ATP-binding protein [Kitasatospora azatica]|uniref:ABC transporter ATP-binding protein n=1 Tax=Kitasatospora azatica TaxID=58347 RepID=UPI00055E911A|nr:ABC transporter ATP-binding protein [Kitasatospora azatica]